MTSTEATQDVWSKKSWEAPETDKSEYKPEILDYEQAKAVEAQNMRYKGVDKSGKSGIIKAITVEDITTADKNGVISDECKEIIANTIEKFKNNGHNFNFDDVRIIDIPPNKKGEVEVLRTNAVDRYGYPTLFLEINKNVFANASKENIDKLFQAASNTVCNSLEDAVIHEIGHAKAIYKRSYANYERISEELEQIHHKGISKLAESDGLECIAECEVLLSRGVNLSDEMMKFYLTYTTGGG